MASPERLSETQERLGWERKGNPSTSSPQKAEREYLAREMLAILKDQKSLGFYRRIAKTVPPGRIFEALSTIRQMSREGSIRKNRGAAFVSLIRTLHLRGSPQSR